VLVATTDLVTASNLASHPIKAASTPTQVSPDSTGTDIVLLCNETKQNRRLHNERLMSPSILSTGPIKIRGKKDKQKK
jgi:hypothetical protein